MSHNAKRLEGLLSARNLECNLKYYEHHRHYGRLSLLLQMALQVRPAVLSDFDAIAKLTDDSNSKGSLACPLLFHLWPVDADKNQSLHRSAWSAAQDAWRFQHDPTAHFVKVVDTAADDEILAIARWHHYPDGWPTENLWMEIDTFAPPPAEPNFPPGLDGPELIEFINAATAQRLTWDLTSGPCWILTTLVTRSGYRKKGAGGMIVDWGAKEAEKMGVPACLEADPDAVGMYEKHGFKKWQHDDDGGELGVIRMYRKI